MFTGVPQPPLKILCWWSLDTCLHVLCSLLAYMKRENSMKSKSRKPKAQSTSNLGVVIQSTGLSSAVVEENCVQSSSTFADENTFHLSSVVVEENPVLSSSIVWNRILFPQFLTSLRSWDYRVWKLETENLDSSFSVQCVIKQRWPRNKQQCTKQWWIVRCNVF